MLIYDDARIGRDGVYIHSTRTAIPLTKAFCADVLRGGLLVAAVMLIYSGRIVTPHRRRPTVGFYPAKPKPWYLIWNVSKYLGLRVSEDPEECDFFFYFEDRAKGARGAGPGAGHNKRVLNANCTDIGKDRVAAVFEEVFGYGLKVDPLTYRGLAVCKSTDNGKHDGKVVLCPVDEVKPGYVYQRLIENTDDGRHVQDIRVPVVGNTIPFCYIKERPIETRFANDNTGVTMYETGDLLTRQEQRQLMRFCRRMGLDFGGLDVLRDRKDGRIYVVDVNKTCMGPPLALPFVDKVTAVRRLAEAFRTMVHI